MRECRQSGFTLIEVTIYIGIVAVILSSAVFFALAIEQTTSKTVAVSSVLQNARHAEFIIRKFIAEADSIVSPAIGSTDTQLELAMQSGAANVQIYVIGNALVVEQDASQSVLTGLPVQVKNISFTVSSNSVRPSVHYTFEVNVGNQSAYAIAGQVIEGVMSPRK